MLTATDPANVTVRGANFAPVSVVQVNGSVRPTSFVNSSQLTVTLSVADLIGSGVLALAVFTPSPGGGTSMVSVAILDRGDVLPFSSGQGATTIQSSGSSTTFVTGFAGIRLAGASGSLPTVFARWSSIRNGATVSEANVPAAVPFTAGRAFVFITGSVNTA